MCPPAVKGRTYDNSGRAAKAEATRRRILDAARDAFIEHGYAGTSMAAIAERAGVSTEAIYKGFRTKAALARAVLDVAIAGDDEPVSMPERPEVRAIAEPSDAKEVLRRYARHARALLERLGALPAALLLGARAGEADLREIQVEADAQRLEAAGLLIRVLRRTGQLRADLDEERARDVIWALNSPELHWMLTVERGWTGDDYEELLTRALIALLVGDQDDHTTP
jgi:AcrR family transcriptional regulator